MSSRCRRYHSYKDGYLLPNDDTERERLDLTHHLFCLTLDGDLCLTKLNNPERILDVGTGTGIWAIEMGDGAYCTAESRPVYYLLIACQLFRMLKSLALI